MTEPLHLLLRCSLWVWASTRVISSHTVSPRPLEPKSFCPQLSNWLPNALQQRVLITLRLVNGDDGTSAGSSHEPPAWPHMINPPEQTRGGTLVQHWTTFSHKLFFVLVQLQCSSHLILSPTKNTRECPCVSKTLLLIGIWAKGVRANERNRRQLLSLCICLFHS